MGAHSVGIRLLRRGDQGDWYCFGGRASDILWIGERDGAGLSYFCL